MAILAGFANFGVFESQIVTGDALASAANIIDGEDMFRVGLLAFLVVALLDIIVAWALNEVLRGHVPALSSLAAVLRYVYAGVLVVASAFAGLAVSITSGAESAEQVDLAILHAWLDAFAFTWDIGLMLFACHLLVLGWAIEKSKIARTWVGLGWIVMIAGAGYLFDSVAVVMNWDIGFEFGAFLFIGEVVLIGWLLVAGFRSTPESTRASTQQ